MNSGSETKDKRGTISAEKATGRDGNPTVCVRARQAVFVRTGFIFSPYRDDESRFHIYGAAGGCTPDSKEQV